MKRLLTLLLCLSMLLSLLPLSPAYAQEDGSLPESVSVTQPEVEAQEPPSTQPAEPAEPTETTETTETAELAESADLTDTAEAAGGDELPEPAGQDELPDTIVDESNVDPQEPEIDEELEQDPPEVTGEQPEEQPASEPEPPEELDLYGEQSFDEENAIQLAGEHAGDQILIKFKDPSQVPGKEKQLQHEIDKFEKIGFVEELDVYVVQLEELEKNPNAVLNRLKNNKYVEYVELNYIYTAEYTPNDPNYKAQTAAMSVIGAPAGWDILKGGGPAIAIVDSGIVAHPDLPTPVASYSAVSSLSPSYDRLGHGTSVAGAAAMVGDNGIGGTGINWDAQVMNVKIDDENGKMLTSNVAKGIIWAADNGAKVINLSLGSASGSVTMKNAIDYAYNKGCAIFAASGNESMLGVCYPARYSNVMAVGGTSNGTTRAALSNYGPELDVVAVNSYNTTRTNGGYAVVAGTSFASPAAAALAAMVWEINPRLTNEQVYDLIRQGAKPLGGGYNEQTGHGLINLDNTLKLALETLGGAQEQPTEPPKYTSAPVITLNSLTEVHLFVGDRYTEMGYTAVDCLGVDITANVKVTGSVNTAVAGLYTLTYTVADGGGNTAKATRTIKVEAKPVDEPAPTAPKLTVIGSSTIILHLDSATAYKEQGAKAVDFDGKDISSLVQVIGAPNRTVAGTYTVTYKVTSPTSGLEATATRTVRILAPSEARPVRTPYGFSAQGKAKAKITHTNIVAEEFGWMDLKISNLDKNVQIKVSFVNTATKKTVFSESFSATGSKQYQIDAGKYELVVEIEKASGNKSYKIDLLMPEVMLVTFAEPEVPLFVPALVIELIGKGETPLEICTRFACSPEALNSFYADFAAAGWSDADLAWFGLQELAEDDIPLGEAPDMISYTVVAGDSLWRIAQKLYGDGNRWREIYELNRQTIGENPSYLRIGERLTVKAK